MRLVTTARLFLVAVALVALALPAASMAKKRAPKPHALTPVTVVDATTAVTNKVLSEHPFLRDPRTRLQITCSAASGGTWRCPFQGAAMGGNVAMGIARVRPTVRAPKVEVLQDECINVLSVSGCK
jgi:hypothetical protein